MKNSILTKLENLKERHEEISAELADPDVISNQNEFTRLSKEYAQLEPIVKKFSEYQQSADDLSSAKEMTLMKRSKRWPWKK